jgi:two-component system chemotaxis response regulator CheB
MISLTQVYGEKIIGVLLTGMGIDGGTGMMSIKIARGQTIVQSPESSVVASMPRTAIGKCAADLILDAGKIGNQIRINLI